MSALPSHREFLVGPSGKPLPFRRACRVDPLDAAKGVLFAMPIAGLLWLGLFAIAF